MTNDSSKAVLPDGHAKATEARPKCFIIMPISDQPGYETDHFTRVYQDIIGPACIQAGYRPKRADEKYGTNIIHLEIIKELIEAPMAICDLSSRNPNVMFELGMRQAFDMPVVLIRDEKTIDIFDVAPLRSIPYKSTRIYPDVMEAHEAIMRALQATAVQSSDGSSVNSLVRLIELNKARLDQNPSTDPTTTSIRVLQDQITFLTNEIGSLVQDQKTSRSYKSPSGYVEITASNKARGERKSVIKYRKDQVFEEFRKLPLAMQEKVMSIFTINDRRILIMSGLYEESPLTISQVAMQLKVEISEAEYLLTEAINRLEYEVLESKVSLEAEINKK